MHRFLAFLFSFLVSFSLSAQEFYSPKEVFNLIEFVKSDFWGKAILPNGRFVRPINWQEQNSLIIPFDEAARIVKAAVPASYGFFCGLDWKAYFIKFTKKERERKVWSDRQMAFILYLFSASKDQALQRLNTEQVSCGEDFKRFSYKTLTQARLSILLKSQS